MNFLKSVLCILVDCVNWKFIIGDNIKFILLSHFYFFDFAIKIVISYFLCIKIEKANLSLHWSLILHPKNWIHFSWLLIFWQSYCNDSIERIQLNWVEIVCTNNLSLLYLFLFVLYEGTPSEDVLFELFLRTFNLFKENESNSIIIGNNGWFNINFILKLENSLFGNSEIVLKIIDLHLVVFLDMVLALFLSACCGFKQETNLSFVDFQNSLNLFRGEMIYGALLRLFPGQ